MQKHMLSTTAGDKEFREPETGKQPGRVPSATGVALHLLVVDPDLPVLEACCEIGANLGYQVYGAPTASAARTQLATEKMDVVLMDLRLPEGGISFLEEIRTNYPQVTVVAMTAHATVNSAVEAMRLGASDYLTKPFALNELVTMLERAGQRRRFDTESRRLRGELRHDAGMGTLVGSSPAMQKIYRILSKVAFSTHPVLILGESGTGKEMVAHAIHRYGPSSSKRFVAIDCGALVPTLIESELFGHMKGSFTGAMANKEGLLASAAGGTVFLDEIGELPLDLQAKLLRALQEKEVRPIGSNTTVPIHARILAATNRDLSAMVENGQFRRDLYFRLNVVSLRIPPLRDRLEDVPLLAAHFLEHHIRESGVGYTFSEEALRVMSEYDWPGNVRELANAIERAVALSSGPVLHMADMPTQLQDFRAHAQEEGQVIDTRISRTGAEMHAGDKNAPSGVHAVMPIAELEKQAILSTIRQLGGDKLMAARLLGIGKTTLYRKLREYGEVNEN